jgi:long-chain acyl-CoA synthetase
MTLTPEKLGEQSDLKLPEVLGELAEFNLKRYGEYPFLYYEGQAYTNTFMADQARRLASGLMAHGVKPGDRVLVMAINSPELLITYQAVLRMGGVVVPLLPVLRTPEIQHIASNCKPRAVVCNFPLAQIIKPALEGAELPEPATIIAIGDPAEVEAAGLVSYANLIAASEPYTDPPPAKPEDLAIIIYTSGTTGKPKGVMLSNRNKISNLVGGATPEAMDHIMGRTTRDKEPGLAALPLAHAYGLTVSNLAYFNGDPLILMSRFETQKAFELIEQYKIAGFGAVPAMLVAMLNYPDAEKYDTSSLQRVVSGSAPLPESVLLGFQKRFGATIYEGYGLSEATTSVSGHRLGMNIKVGSVGTPNANNEVRVVDNDDNPLPPGERGEIVVRGPNVMMGYYNNSQATEEVLRNGWLHTGDVGYLDEDGYIYIVERKKDLIIRGGQNVYPRDAEEVLAQHPAVMECSVVGIPSEKYGEEVKAYVALRPGMSATEQELIDFCQQSLAKYKTPAYIEFIEALPRNPVGKINKRALREMAAQNPPKA